MKQLHSACHPVVGIYKKVIIQMSLSIYFLPVKDAVRYSQRLRQIYGWYWYVRGYFTRHAAQRVSHIARALTMLTYGIWFRRVVQTLNRHADFDSSKPWAEAVRAEPRYASLLKDSPQLTRSLILKAPGPAGEKGVLLMTFEYNWVRLLLGLSEPERRWIDEHFDLVLSTSWSPTDYSVLGLAVSSLKGHIHVQSCNYGEVTAIESFHPRLHCLQTLPCDWINPGLYEPLPAASRQTDIVMVANWGAFKRHWELFRALSRMPAELKVVLIGQREPGRSRESILSLARSYGVPQQLEIHESLPIEEVARHQSNAKVSVILSRREGCCVAAVESLFAGCALAMREDAHVGPLAYINEQTGRRLRPGRIHHDLMELIKIAGSLRPRQWAMENIACHLSREKLNTALKAAAQRRGSPWTKDIVLPQWRPHPTHAHAADRAELLDIYTELHQRFPQVFGATLLDTSWK